MARRQRNDDDVAAPVANFARADDRRFGVVAALHEHIRAKRVISSSGVSSSKTTTASTISSAAST